jgi:hypothetical protein
MYTLNIHFWEDKMKATVVDLRYKMTEVLKALDRREKITLLYHGKVKGTILPAEKEQVLSVEDHPLFNMAGKKAKTVSKEMDDLRKSRFNDL